MPVAAVQINPRYFEIIFGLLYATGTSFKPLDKIR